MRFSHVRAQVVVRCLLVISVLCMVAGWAAAQTQPVGADPHAGHREPADPGTPTADGESQRSITDEDRAAAFPVLHDSGHPLHGQSINSFVLFDRFEWRNAEQTRVGWDARGWVGRDLDRVWFRTEGDVDGERRDGVASGAVHEAQVHVLYGRAVARWWDVVVGLRQDWRPGAAQTWAAVGLQGLAPYFFEVEATAYVGAGGRTQLRFEAEYDLLLTNRLILQPLLELQASGQRDDERALGAGLSSAEGGLRLRYELRREIAPYVGVVWSRSFFGTARYETAAGRPVSRASFAIGARVWF